MRGKRLRMYPYMWKELIAVREWEGKTELDMNPNKRAPWVVQASRYIYGAHAMLYFRQALAQYRLTP